MIESNNVRGQPKFSLRGRLKSCHYALAGLAYVLKTQHNAWLHVAAAMVVTGTALRLNVSAADWRWLVAAIAMVWVAEAINTALEYVCDVVSPSFHQAVKHAKDIAAGAVLIAAAAALVIGALTVWPYCFTTAAPG